MRHALLYVLSQVSVLSFFFSVPQLKGDPLPSMLPPALLPRLAWTGHVCLLQAPNAVSSASVNANSCRKSWALAYLLQTRKEKERKEAEEKEQVRDKQHRALVNFYWRRRADTRFTLIGISLTSCLRRNNMHNRSLTTYPLLVVALWSCRKVLK